MKYTALALRLAERNLKAPEREGFDENNISRFHHGVKLRFERQVLLIRAHSKEDSDETGAAR
ncbi:MAG: hypothetical protein D6743_16745 [Calditrichaeota bacterium]|nr:MAG: hypothetical protein D6743_16745 [Calditrichota bacterium]